jgi:hypothetical protein
MTRHQAAKRCDLPRGDLSTQRVVKQAVPNLSEAVIIKKLVPGSISRTTALYAEDHQQDPRRLLVLRGPTRPCARGPFSRTTKTVPPLRHQVRFSWSCTL